MRKHNKRRNSLLMYEFLVRTISKTLVEDDKKQSSAALKILRKHYKPGTELYKEFRLLNALAKTTVSSEHVAASIMKEAKAAAQRLDEEKLDREKSLLIRNINHGLNDDNFYDQQVNEYKEYATLQTLVNEWRSPDKDIRATAQFEDQVIGYLVNPKQKSSDVAISEESSGTTRLLMKIMTKKLNEKYGGILSDQQKSLIKSYAYSSASEDQASISRKLNEIKEGLLTLLDREDAIPDNEYVKNKLKETKSVLSSESFDEINDEVITRFMLYSRLKEELESKE